MTGTLPYFEKVVRGRTFYIGTPAELYSATTLPFGTGYHIKRGALHHWRLDHVESRAYISVTTTSGDRHKDIFIPRLTLSHIMAW